MTLDHRATSRDIAAYVYTDADRRAHEALMGDILPPPGPHYAAQDWQRGTLARIEPPAPRSRLAPLLWAAVALICLAVGVAFGARL